PDRVERRSARRAMIRTRSGTRRFVRRRGDRLQEPESATRGPATACPSCGGNPRWESLVDGDQERWLAVCRCGRMRVFLPEQPGLEFEDPLRAFLLGPGRPIFPA